MIWGPPIGWLRYVSVPPAATKVAVPTPSPEYLDQCRNHGLRIKDEFTPQQFRDDTHRKRGLMMSIEPTAAPTLITALCALDANQDAIINSHDFAPVVEVVADAESSYLRTKPAREVMIDAVAAAFAQGQIMYDSRRTVFAQGIRDLFEIYPALHAMDESLLLMVRSQRNEGGSELELAADDYAALKSRIGGFEYDTFVVQGTLDDVSDMNDKLASLVQALFVHHSHAQVSTDELHPIAGYKYVYGGIEYPLGFLSPALERALERVRVRWMRVLSRLRQIDEIECDTGRWWDLGMGSECRGDKEHDFSRMQGNLVYASTSRDASGRPEFMLFRPQLGLLGVAESYRVWLGSQKTPASEPE